MRYAIFGDGNKKPLINKLKEHNFVNDEENPEICFSLGGDGTVLRAIHK